MDHRHAGDKVHSVYLEFTLVKLYAENWLEGGWMRWISRS